MKLEGVTAFKIRACPASMEIMELHKNCWESCGTMHRWTALDWGGNIESIHSMEHSSTEDSVASANMPPDTDNRSHTEEWLVNNFSQLSSGAWL